MDLLDCLNKIIVLNNKLELMFEYKNNYSDFTIDQNDIFMKIAYEQSNTHIQLYYPDGELITSLILTNYKVVDPLYPQGILINDDKLYLCDGDNNIIQIIPLEREKIDL